MPSLDIRQRQADLSLHRDRPSDAAAWASERRGPESADASAAKFGGRVMARMLRRSGAKEVQSTHQEELHTHTRAASISRESIRHP
jgi:hypothetical protein